MTRALRRQQRFRRPDAALHLKQRLARTLRSWRSLTLARRALSLRVARLRAQRRRASLCATTPLWRWPGVSGASCAGGYVYVSLYGAPICVSRGAELRFGVLCWHAITRFNIGSSRYHKTPSDLPYCALWFAIAQHRSLVTLVLFNTIARSA